jgi:hypothetical protein
MPGFTAELALAPVTDRFRTGAVTPETPLRDAVVLQDLHFCFPCHGTQRICCTVDVNGFQFCHAVPCLHRS